MTAILFDRLPLAAHMVQRVTRSRPSMTITAPSPRAHCIPYDVISDRNRDAYIAQSAATSGNKVAPFPVMPSKPRVSVTVPAPVSASERYAAEQFPPDDNDNTEDMA